jgi:hypothetical protein
MPWLDRLLECWIGPRLAPREILELARAHSATSADALKQHYDWLQQSSRAAAVGIFVGALSLLATVATSVLKQDFQAETWLVIVVALSSVLVAGIGAALLRHVRVVGERFLFDLEVLTLLERIVEW